MQYFRWHAYNCSGESFSGVMEAQTWELVIIRLMQQKLFPSEVVSIEYSEYITNYKVGIKLEHLRAVKKHLLPEVPIIKTSRRFRPFVATIATVLGVILILLVIHYCLL